jgi:hypothetical protein
MSNQKWLLFFFALNSMIVCVSMNHGVVFIYNLNSGDEFSVKTMV